MENGGGKYSVREILISESRDRFTFLDIDGNPIEQEKHILFIGVTLAGPIKVYFQNAFIQNNDSYYSFYDAYLLTWNWSYISKILFEIQYDNIYKKYSNKIINLHEKWRKYIIENGLIKSSTIKMIFSEGEIFEMPFYCWIRIKMKFIYIRL